MCVRWQKPKNQKPKGTGITNPANSAKYRQHKTEKQNPIRIRIQPKSDTPKIQPFVFTFLASGPSPLPATIAMPRLDEFLFKALTMANILTI